MISRIFKIAYYLVIAVIAVIAIFLILSVFPLKSGYGTFIVLSGSMEPKIHAGSVVAIKTQRDYQVGDVITFGENTKKKKPTTHRIIEVKRNNQDDIVYITKGDANNAADQQPVGEDKVLGKVFLSIPLIGYAVASTQKPIGFILIIVVPAVIIIYDELQNIKKEISKKIDYKKRIKKREENKDNEEDEKEI